MNISGIRPNAGFYEQNSIISHKIESVLPNSSISEAEQVREAENQVTEQRSEERFFAKKNSLDYAAGYQPNETYSLKGKNSDLASLDVEQAISTMQKDKVIHQYQFFVGESKMQNQLEQMRMQPRGMEDFNI